ncbi:AraC family transcriptional regulator (plasmid) [Leptospira kobayashii]|uniref:AraC family transcriptional regulator n=1 Tax=Leptospira kobayashii TaxID=1917830 RepID=A0ABM7UP45_9LEPT|nr:AraC family transcriptional regulator [Leptospira kobayashii]BDA80949.1 AraC family transcriptional regulator [Leptospira kobayashii]
MAKQTKDKLYPVWEYIENNLEVKFGLNQLAFFSNFSPWHFHRFFKKHQGENVQSYIKRLRIEKAAYELKISDFPILEIAMEAGYESNEAFTRAFKRFLGKTPSQFRNDSKQTKTNKGKTKLLFQSIGLDEREFRMKEIPEFRIAYVRHIGPYSSLPGPIPGSIEVKSILHFLNSIGSDPKDHKWIGISLDDPAISPENKIRFDLGVTVGTEHSPEDKLGIRTVSGGKYMQVRYRGSYTNLPFIYEFLLQEYIPAKKIRIRNIPPFEIYLNPIGGLSKKKITDIYIPVKS